MHESGAQGEDELLARVHPPGDAVAQPGVDAGVAVHVLVVRATPLGDEVVLAVEGGTARIGVMDRPRQPAHDLLAQVGEPLRRIRRVPARDEVGAGLLEASAQVAPGDELGRLRHQNTATGFTTQPVPPIRRSGAMVRRNA